MKRVKAADRAAEAGIGAVEPLEPRMLLALVEWDGGAGTDSWHDALNWSGDAVPTEVDDVVIGESETPVRISGGGVARSLTTSSDVLVQGSLYELESVDLHARLTLGNGTSPGYLRFVTGHDGVISGDGDVYLDYSGTGQGSSISATGAPLRIAAGVLVHGGGGQIYVGNGNLVIDGEVRADHANRSILLNSTANGARVIVSGLLQSTAGILQLGGDSIIVEDGGVIRSTGGRFELWGIVENTGCTFTIAAGAGDIYLRSGGFRGGTVRSAGGAGLRVDGSLGYSLVAGLIGVHLEAPMWVYNNGEVRIYDGLVLDGTLTLGRGASGVSVGRVVFWNSTPVQALTGFGEIVFDYIGGSRPQLVSNYLSAAQNVQLTIDEGITIRGRGGMVRAEPGAVITTHATISADTPGYLFVGQPWQGGMIVNHGRFDATNGGVLAVGQNSGAQVTFGEGTTFTGAGGRLQVRGLNIEASEPIFFDAEVGTLEVSYSTIVGSVISSRGGTVAFGNSTVLDAVVLDVTSEIIGGTRIRNGLTLDAPMTFAHLERYSPSGGLQFFDTAEQLLGGEAIITFPNSIDSPNRVVAENGVALTIGPGITIRGGPGSVNALAGASILLMGTIEASYAGRTIQLTGDITLHGVMRIAAGSTIARTGSLVMQDGASLEVEIAGTANSQMGRLTATGGIILHGGVRVSYVGGFVPQRGQSFRFVASAAIAGGFDTTSTPPLPDADLKSPVLIDSLGVRLVVTHIADVNNDLAVNEADVFWFLGDWFAGGGDFDGNGERTVADIFVFLSAWYRGR